MVVRRNIKSGFTYIYASYGCEPVMGFRCTSKLYVAEISELNMTNLCKKEGLRFYVEVEFLAPNLLIWVWLLSLHAALYFEHSFIMGMYKLL